MIVPDEVWTRIVAAHTKAEEVHLWVLKSLKRMTTALPKTTIKKLAELQLALDEEHELLTIVTQENGPCAKTTLPSK